MRLTVGILLLCTLGSFALEEAKGGATTLLIVRHADRPGDQDDLTPAGIARAKELVHAASQAGVTAIYCTKTARSRKTAEPLAAALKLTPIELDPKDPEGVVKHVLANNRGKTVVVVGHSNTVPKIIAAAGGPTLPDLKDGDFDNLYVLTLGSDPSTDVRLVTLQYGAATP